MTIRQTIEIPANRNVHIDLVVPDNMPCGKTEVTLIFPQKNEFDPLLPRESYHTIEEAIAAAERRRIAAETDPSVYSLARFHGILKDSVWGEGDATEYIRAMRDECKDPWDTEDDPAEGEADDVR